jgi:8-hydroxy-5-deazaflavin:NADPH oxidoreductase
MKIGVLGSGDVGRVLGAGLAARGHEVKLGTREPGSGKVQSWLAKAGPKASAGSLEEAAKFAELAVLATAWSGTENAVRLAGPGNLEGKIVIDATNPLEMGPSGLTLAVAGNDSAGERVQKWLPGAYVVKAFNTVGNAHMVDPRFPGGPPDMFIAGNDEGAKKQVGEIAASLGWPVIDLGGIESSRYLEPLAMVWIVHSMRTKNSGHAFKLLRKS